MRINIGGCGARLLSHVGVMLPHHFHPSLSSACDAGHVRLLILGRAKSAEPSCAGLAPGLASLVLHLADRSESALAHAPEGAGGEVEARSIARNSLCCVAPNVRPLHFSFERVGTV